MEEKTIFIKPRRIIGSLPRPRPHPKASEIYRGHLGIAASQLGAPGVAFGSFATSTSATAKSALPRITDIAHHKRHVRFVPIPEVTASFDHLVDTGKKRRRHCESERLG